MAVEAKEIIALGESLIKKHSPDVLMMATLRLYTQNIAEDNSFVPERFVKVLTDTANTCIAANCTLLGIAPLEVDEAFEGFMRAGKIAYELHVLPA
jgi:hypothetical protein